MEKLRAFDFNINQEVGECGVNLRWDAAFA